MAQLELTYWQRRRLKDQLKQATTARVFRRTLAVLEADRGKPVDEIAATLGTSRRSVYRWIDAYRQTRDPKALWEGEHTGRPSAWDEGSEARLRCLMEHRPDECGYLAVNWTASLLSDRLKQATGRSFSEDMVREELQRLGYVWKRGRYELEPDPELEKKTADPPSGPQFACPYGAAGGG
jgi:transposase